MPSLAQQTYDAIGPFYDGFSHHHDYDLWLSTLLAVAERHGLAGEHALDLACGTGKSYGPLIERGWSITAVDVSEAMLAVARAKPNAANVVFVQADMADLPDLGRFDLVTCLGDAMNYLTRPGDPSAAIRCAYDALAPGGIYLFDVNTLSTYRTAFADSDKYVAAGPTLRVVWWQQSRFRCRPGDPRRPQGSRPYNGNATCPSAPHAATSGRRGTR